MKLPASFFLRNNVLEISKDLLGKFLFTNFDGVITGGMIVETEAYRAPEDKASHAHGGKRTPRTETFYLQGGVSYVYLCYGIHHLFNIVTNQKEVPHAILIRAIEPTEGIPEMMVRRNKTKLDRTLTAGPGAMSQALGITVKHNAYDLQSNTIWLEDRGIRYKPAQIGKGPRIGVAYAEEYAEKPWRFWVKGNTYVSKQ